jgi:hypothetical protein
LETDAALIERSWREPERCGEVKRGSTVVAARVSAGIVDRPGQRPSPAFPGTGVDLGEARS